MSNDSISKTLLVAVLLCLVCSIVVSGAAVYLKPEQQKNKLLDKQKNILLAAGMLQPGQKVAEQFAKIEKRLVNIDTGEYVTEGVDIDSYDQRKAKKDPKMSQRIDAEIDIADLKRRANYAEVYLVNDEQGNLKTLILPISGYGLWSTLYGFVALENDLNTVVGLAFYDHGETPGLGGEVDNPKWKAQWPGKQIYGDADAATGATYSSPVKAQLKKGGIDPNNETDKRYYVDALSGATLTSEGINNLIRFWLGPNGFQPYLEKLAANILAQNGNSQSVLQKESVEVETAPETEVQMETNSL